MLTTRPMAMPTHVSSSRPHNRLDWLTALVASTTIAVVATEVDSSPISRTRPIRNASISITPIATGSSPSTAPTPHARKTPAKVASTCWAPRENVR